MKFHGQGGINPPLPPPHTRTLCVFSDKFCDKESGVRKVVLRGTMRSVVMAQQLIMDLVWEEMETAIGVMQFMIPDEVNRLLPAISGWWWW